MRQVWTMTVSELRQRVRDRSVIIFALVVPLALMVVFDLTFGDPPGQDLGTVEVAVSVPDAEPLAAQVVGAALASGAVDVARSDLAPDGVREAVRAGDAALGVVVPEGFDAAVRAGHGVVVEVVEGDDAGLGAAVVVSVLDGALDQVAAGTRAAVAGSAAGLPPEALEQVAQAAATGGPTVRLVAGEAGDEQLSGSGALVAGQAGLFLLFTVGFGVLGLIAEREQGTLARLRSMPMRPGLVVVAKALVSVVLGVVATSVLLVVGSLLFDVSFGSPVAVAVLVLAVVTAAVSVMFVIARLARTAEQASIAQSITAMVLGLAGGAFFPMSGAGVLGTLLDLNPIAAFTRGLGITSGGGGPGDVGVPVAVMLGFAVVVLAVSRVLPDRGTQA